MADLEHIPDPSPTPDLVVSDMLDGQRAAAVPLARWAAVIARLPPAVADALAAEYHHAAGLTGDEALRYRPTASDIARACGLTWRQLNRLVARAILSARADAALSAPSARRPVNKLSTGEGRGHPPTEGPGRGKEAATRTQRGSEERVTNAGRTARRAGRP